MNDPRNWIAAALFAAFLLVTSAWLDGPDDVQAEADAKAAHVEAAASAASVTEREKTIWRVCRSLHGERAQVLETTDGNLVCRRTSVVM